MALIQLTLLNGLPQFFQHPDRIVSRRAVEWALDGSIVAQLRDRCLYPVDRLILRHSSEGGEGTTRPPAAFEVVLVDATIRPTRLSSNCMQPTKGPMQRTSDVYCKGYLM